jgi:probable rRNA maturation factor
MKPARNIRTTVPGPTIDIQVQSPRWRAEPGAKQTVRDAITAAAATISTKDGEVGMVLTDDETIRLLNRDWRGIDKPTNVLSFPAATTRVSVTGTKFLGDIVLAYETIQRECDHENRIFLHHLAHLVVHGFLHLCGYDHQLDTEADAMERLESRILADLDIPDPYLQRDFGAL